jgi:hypothetical protein
MAQDFPSPEQPREGPKPGCLGLFLGMGRQARPGKRPEEARPASSSRDSRDRLLRRCDEIHKEERMKDRGYARPDPGKLIVEGVYAARKAIEAAPLDPDRPRYLADLKARVEEVKAKYRSNPVSEDGYDDQDGYILGGLSTVLREIEKEESGR